MQNVENGFDEWWHAIFTLEETFFMYSRMIQDSLRSCVLYVGLEDKASNYKYKITINTADRLGSNSACHVTYSHLNDVEEIFKKCKCVMFHSEYVKKCMDPEKCLLAEVEIYNHVDSNHKTSTDVCTTLDSQSEQV
jgi:hypothetical protein